MPSSSSSSGEPQKTSRVSSNLCRSASASLGHLDRRRGDGSAMTATAGGGCDDSCGGGRSGNDYGRDDYGGGRASGDGHGALRRHPSDFGSLNCLHRPRTLMEALLIAKMEKARDNGRRRVPRVDSSPTKSARRCSPRASCPSRADGPKTDFAPSLCE